MLFAYDLDGTLVDNKAAVELAYRLAGANPPEGFFGKPWHTWLDNDLIHRAKTDIYLTDDAVGNMIRRRWLCKLYDAKPGPILTGASPVSGAFTLYKASLEVKGPIYYGQSREAKLALLQKLGMVGVWFDDDPLMCEMVKRELSGWQAVQV